MRGRIALVPNPSLTSGAVIPKLAMRARCVVAHIDVSVEAIDGVGRLRIGTFGRSVTEVGELSHIAQATMGAGDPHGRSMQVGLRAGAALVEHGACGIAIKAQFSRGRMRLVARDQMREAPARSRRRLEAAVAPAGVEIDTFYGRMV